MLAGVGVLLGCGLRFDQTSVGQHHYVHVDCGAGVFFVAEVEQEVAIHDTDGCGGDHLAEWRGLERAGGDELVERKRERDSGSGDGCGTGASVGLENVAVEDDGALAEGLHVDDGAQAAADEALDLVGASADLAALALARSAGESGAGEHPVFACDPSAAGVAQPGGNALLDGGVAQDAGVARFDQHGAFGGSDKIWSEADGAELVGGAVVGAEQSFGHWVIIVAGKTMASDMWIEFGGYFGAERRSQNGTGFQSGK